MKKSKKNKQHRFSRAAEKHRSTVQKPADVVSQAKADPAEVEHFVKRIRTFLVKENGRPLRAKDLMSKCRGRGKHAFQRALLQMQQSGEIAVRHNGYVLSAAVGMIRGSLTSLHRTYGFAQPEDGGTPIFIPGRDLKGAMPGDLLLLQPMGMSSRGDSPEAAVVTVIHAAAAQAAGMLVEESGELRFLPDTLCRQTLSITNPGESNAAAGDKVIVTIVYRGQRHSEHKVRIDAVLGSSDSAFACSKAIVAVSGAPMVFAQGAIEAADALFAAGISEDECAGRLDLRQSTVPIFTIDGADTKDIDDAISIERTEDGYRLGVHIADVSHYVRPDSLLDENAFARGTSVYYADAVIPMLPKSLSNGICSLFADTDRLALSALMELNAQGEILSYRFEKTIIHSCLQGVYREVNAIFDGTAQDDIEAKYAKVKPSLLILRELLAQRLSARKRRGAPSLETEESAFRINKDGICEDIFARTRAEAEELIEECMLLANEAAAKFARSRQLPFVYRVHEQPPEEKVQRLAEALDQLGIAHKELYNPSPAEYSAILASVAEHPLKSVVHQLVLRAMAKACYGIEPLGHFGLALKDYAHFTSPIRRYPDLMVHRMISTVLTGERQANVLDQVRKAAEQSSLTELRAQQIERQCEDCYRAEYMQQHLGEELEGVISGLTEFGIYVMLPNTVEGMIALDDLPNDEYAYDGFFSLTALRSGTRYTLGQTLRVQCVRADVSSGHIDFALVS